jgi:hypothetical protein
MIGGLKHDCGVEESDFHLGLTGAAMDWLEDL